MKKFYKLLFTSILICSNLTSMPGHGQTGVPSIYQCAPCGCDSDNKQFDKPGNCGSCGMKLEKLTTPFAVLEKLERPLNVAILLYHHAQVLDYAGPYDIFAAGQDNFKVYTVAETSDAVITMPNLLVLPEYDITNAPKADILIVPGGMWNTVGPEFQQWIKESAKEADHVLSICTGAFILAELGLLDNMEATTHSAGQDALERDYPAIQKVLHDVRFVDNGKIMTSGGVTAGMDATFHLISKVLGADWVDAIARNLEYPYYGNEHKGH